MTTLISSSPVTDCFAFTYWWMTEWYGLETRIKNELEESRSKPLHSHICYKILPSGTWDYLWRLRSNMCGKQCVGRLPPKWARAKKGCDFGWFQFNSRCEWAPIRDFRGMKWESKCSLLEKEERSTRKRRENNVKRSSKCTVTVQSTHRSSWGWIMKTRSSFQSLYSSRTQRSR